MINKKNLDSKKNLNGNTLFNKLTLLSEAE